ncbi:MAG: hypothetical protein M5R40_28045 [Anaerolineae bacterium]|nr:hypothetical protein [Anaerolineae bacterium]
MLSRVLASQMQLVPVIINMGGYDLRAVPDPSTGGNLFVYGLVGDFLVLATGNGVEQLIAVASGTTPSLASNETWQGRAMDLAPAVEGVFYFAIADFVDYVRAAPHRRRPGRVRGGQRTGAGAVRLRAGVGGHARRRPVDAVRAGEGEVTGEARAARGICAPFGPCD